MQRPKSYTDWEQTVPEAITKDSLWRMEAYRLALFLVDLGWADTQRLTRGTHTRGVADQLYRAMGSIAANLAEGYSRGSGKDRARFYEYALGSAREARTWYFAGRRMLGEEVTQHRLDLLTQVIRLMLKMVPQQRGNVLREPEPAYAAARNSTDDVEATKLLQIVPYTAE